MSYRESVAERGRRVELSDLMLSGPAGTFLRVGLGVVWAINATLKWLPGYRDSYLSALRGVAQGSPASSMAGFTSGSPCSRAHLPSGLT